MVSYYTVFGKQVASHWISLGTLGTVATLAIVPGYLPKSEKATPAPPAPVQAKEDDLDVEKLLNDFLKDQEAEAKK